MEHEDALKMLGCSKLSAEVKNELYELYLADAEEHSIATALEKLESSIKDLG